MPVVTVQVSGNGKVLVSKKTKYETSYTKIGEATESQNGSIANDFSFGFWDMGLFAASTEPGYQFEKFCADSNLDGKTTCSNKNKQMVEAEIDKSYDVLLAYFIPEPAKPPPPQQDIWTWIRDNLLWWLPK